MIYTLVYKKNNKTIKEIFDFSTNPVFHEIFNIDINELEPMEDFMILENEAAKHIKSVLTQKDVLFFSLIDKNRTLYHDFDDFFSKIY